MTENNFLSEGIVAYHKGSLAFSIIENRLLLEGGTGYNEEGEVLTLKHSSYVVLEKIDLVHFENHTKYYFYLCSTRNAEKIESDCCEKIVELEEGISFCMTPHLQYGTLFLGEVSIDYDDANAQGLGSISIADNVFAPGKNQLDLGKVHKHTFLPSPVSQKKKRQISQILFELSEALYQNAKAKGSFELQTLVNAYFQFSDALLSQNYSPYELYRKFESHCKLFSWIDFTQYPQEVQYEIQMLEAFFSVRKREYKTDFYHLELEDENSLFTQLLHHFKALTQALKIEESTAVKVEAVPEMKVEERVEKAVEEVQVFENVTLVEKSNEDLSETCEENTTVLLNGEYKKSIQVGRGRQSANDIILGETDKTVSRIHLKISPHKQGFFLEDLSSMGTYVDGMRLEKNVKKFVTAKHIVRLGKKECHLDLSDLKIQALTAS